MRVEPSPPLFTFVFMGAPVLYGMVCNTLPSESLPPRVSCSSSSTVSGPVVSPASLRMREPVTTTSLHRFVLCQSRRTARKQEPRRANGHAIPFRLLVKWFTLSHRSFVWTRRASRVTAAANPLTVHYPSAHPAETPD
jgi:hypothetical protein